MSSTRRQSEQSRAASPRVEDPLEAALEGLRREWRAGFDDRLAVAITQSSVRRLRERAATQQADAAIEEIERRLGRYRSLPREQRKAEVEQLAGALNALRPHLRLLETPAAPFGKLSTAIDPGRSQRSSNKTPADSPRTAVKPLAPDDPVTALPRVGTSVAQKLENLGVTTVRDLLTLSPREHIDYSRAVRIGSAIDLRDGERLTVQGEIIDLQEHRGPGKGRVVIKLSDGSGWLRVTWFNTYLARQMRLGDEIVVSGKLEMGFGRPSLTSPEWERVGDGSLSTGRLVPVYPLTKDLGQKTLRALTRAALDATYATIEDHLPREVRERNHLIGLVDAYEQLHYPAKWGDLELAQRRLAFDDLFLLQLGLVRRKRERKAAGGVAFKVDPGLLQRFGSGLPFRLTEAQERALGEVVADLARPEPMTRLLQGDVGSGKTVVAAAAALIVVGNAFQAAVMAPTEILAEQHYHNFRGLYAHLDEEERPAVALLTGSTRAAERRDTLAAVASGEVDVLVGTHALIQGTVVFPRLGLAVVDEQHRFGVRQRSELPGKGIGTQPDTLSMTATPIPRTLNMVLNGDLDVSVIGELPPGRVPIETRRYVGFDRVRAYDLVREQVRLGHQVFVICPLVEESEAVEAKAAVAEAERLQREVFPDLRVALLHGRMSGKEKDAVLTGFRDREADILVSTSVIEVGIDVPNATVMLIEGADRFGLSQLHQFRGRVGRGGARSYCLLLAEEATPEGEARLQTMVETTDGFVLAEKDLELRGPGDFIGTRQSGLPEMSWLDGSFDTRLLDQAREAAEEVLKSDPELGTPEHTRLARRLDLFWTKASPDVPL